MDPYITVDDADTYFENRYGVDSWDTADDTDKLKALKDATIRIDRLNYIGRKNDDEQEKQFPRYDDTTVPEDIQYACAEIAFALLDGIDPEREMELLAMKSQGLASARSTYDRTFVPEYLSAGIPSSLAWQFLKPYLVDPENVAITRVT